MKAKNTLLNYEKDYLDCIIKSSADAITVIDLNGIVREWNKAAEDYMQYKAEEVIEKPNKRFFVDPEEPNRIMEIVLKKGELKNYRTMVRRKDGKLVYISLSASLLKDHKGNPIGTVRVSRDITKEVELEQKLKMERDKLKQILDSTSDGVYICTKDHKIEFMNKILIDQFGDNIEDLCYKTFVNRTKPCTLCKMHEVMKGKTIRWEWHSKKTNKTYDLIETPLKNADGSFSKLTIFRDITQRKKLEQKLENYANNLEQKVKERTKELEIKNKEIESFIYTISHDLKAPIISIQGFIALLMQEFSENLNEKSRHYLDRILKNANQIETLINDLLEYSRIGRITQEYEYVNTLEMVKDICKDFELRAKEKNLEFIIKDLPIIYCEANRIKQVFINLIDNAIKYIGTPKNPLIEIGCEDLNNTWKFYVKDNGIGITKEYQKKIFEIFRRIQNDKNGSVDGTGVGLSIVQKIVKLHKGEVWVKSEVNKGSTFYFTLPKNKII